MKQSTHHVSRPLPLQQLVAGAVGELERLHYGERALRRYRTVWRHLAAFCCANSLSDEYSQGSAKQFSDAYQLREEENLERGDGWRRHLPIALKVLADFARDGYLERSLTDTRQLQVPVRMREPIRDYETYCRDHVRFRLSTLRRRLPQIAVFADFLGTRDIASFGQMQAVDVSAFVISRYCLKAKTVSSILSNLRSFLRFLLMRGILHLDLSQQLPTIHVPHDAAIPSVWDQELVVRLLDVVDRTSPKGRRDYAILLLACRLGLRAGDIRALRLDDLKWDACTIEITQSKTLAPLCLPLTEEIGQALIDYLRSDRPQSAYREVFLTLTPPFLPFRESTSLYYIVKHWKELAGIHFRAPQRQGLHSLRHTLATELLREQTPFHVISEILGHTTTKATLIYAKTDVETLRSAALDTEETRHVD
ncbi:site-specific integrase [Paraburkholderia sp. CNPSo 3272]|uniref:site-specific integrase n=1 Tax=Paraburkholderia sp. CNPSo 3272 TaxID=2940931 RepID=UPI0020B8C8DE|nr:site-specific integrase [Paraburkholderia sp. CNPSo 3272]MCP3728315.1 site-specific integrase [Paraburkholderia sp. CNPSo 3272]